MYGIVIAIIVVIGAFGGIVNVALASGASSWKWNVISGIGAAALVPLFLQTVSSGLLEQLFKPPNSVEAHDRELIVFGSFCLLAGISAQRFIETLSNRVLREAREAKEVAQQNRRRLDDVSDRLTETGETARAAIDAVKFGTVDQGVSPDVQPTAIDIAPGSVADDPWKGAFGGSAASNGRLLEATVTPLSSAWQLATVTLCVRATDVSRPLTGVVQFFLHPSIAKPRPVIPVLDGEARLSLVTYGAFTVGALADEGETRLELDLADHPSARPPWKDQ